jgi:hypothetical protein
MTDMGLIQFGGQIFHFVQNEKIMVGQAPPYPAGIRGFEQENS